MLLSVVIPVYRVDEPLLRACLDSLSEQDEDEAEFIIVDDASPDSCGEICREYAKLDKRFKVESLESNRGLPGARNAGLAQARGEYVVFVDGDDLVPVGFFKKLKKYLRQNPDDIVFFAFTRNPEDKGFCHNMDRHELPDALSVAESIITHDELKYLFPKSLLPSASVKVFKRLFLMENNLFFQEGLNKGEDRLFMIAALSYSPTMSYFDCMGYIYIINPNSTCHKYDPAMLPYCEEACDAMEALVRKEYDGEAQDRLLCALPVMRYQFLLDAEYVTFFHVAGNSCFGKEEKAYRRFWEERRSIVDACDMRFMQGKKNRLVLALKKLRMYGIAYRLERAYAKRKVN